MRKLLFSAVLLCLTATAAASTECNSKITCQAYWQGYEFDAKQRACVAMATTACDNPFSYATRAACESVHGRSEMGCMAYWEGYEFDQVEGQCKRISASGCVSPFRFQDQAECERLNPTLRCL